MEGRNSSAASQKPPKAVAVKKREVKETVKTKIKADICTSNIVQERRRSSRIEKLDDKDPSRSKYTVDKLRHNEFRD